MAAEEAKVTARNRSPLPRKTVVKKRSSFAPMRSRSTPMNHRKAIPAKGSRLRASRIECALWASHVPGSRGLSGTESRISTTLMMSKIENRMPAIAPARGAFNPAAMTGSFISSIISSMR